MGFLSARVFSLVFGIVYTITIVWNLPLFRYYPAVERFSLTDLADRSLGPAMSWFGWMGWAFVIAIVAAAIVPRKIADKIPDGTWIFVTLLVFAGGFYREAEWFFEFTPFR
jgi:hypothetical protein